MFRLSGRYQVYLYRKAIDGRWGYDRLAGLCKNSMGQDPYSGDLFLFFNKGKTRVRVIFYDMTTSFMVSGRLEVGSYKIIFNDVDLCRKIYTSDLLTLLAGGKLKSSATQDRPNQKEY